jgi:orotidine-5'-phosphate decarboxylase
MKLCVALDLPSAKENLALATKIKDYDVWLKVGFRAYIRDGKEFLYSFHFVTIFTKYL